jgi:hypothetical protein
MVQQDNKPNNETTVDGHSLFKKPPKPQVPPPTQEYINEYQRDDDPLLSDTERADTRNDDFEHSKIVKKDLGGSHPV